MFLEAFWELSTDRAIGMAVGPVPASAISRWCDEAGIEDLSERASLRGAVRVMDKVYLDYVKESTPTNSDSDEPVLRDEPMTPDRFKSLFGPNNKARKAT